MTSCCSIFKPTIVAESFSISTRKAPLFNLIVVPRNSKIFGGLRIRGSMVDSSSDFIKRTEQAWLISKQPRPVVCSSCDSNGEVDCKWCVGTGFFILGDNMLCQVPSRNSTCVICAGKGMMHCADCKGTGFRAKWLEEPPPVVE